MLVARFVILTLICSAALRNNFSTACAPVLCHPTPAFDTASDKGQLPPDDSDTPVPSEDENTVPSVSDWADEVPCSLPLPVIRTPSARAFDWERNASFTHSTNLVYALRRLRI
jgi:hypothetical protein